MGWVPTRHATLDPVPTPAGGTAALGAKIEIAHGGGHHAMGPVPLSVGRVSGPAFSCGQGGPTAGPREW